MKTFQPKAKEVVRKWHLIDADGKVLGRMATDIVAILMGKKKATYAPHLDMGDYVVVINAKNIKVTGNKEKQKVYYSHSGYPQGFKEVAFEKYLKEQPDKIIKLAVKRMLPDNRLRDPRMARLKVFAGKNHDFEEKFES